MAEIKSAGSESISFPGVVGISNRFALLNHIMFRDMNNDVTNRDKVFTLYKKTDIVRFLTDPRRFEKQLRKAIRYVYGASPHFRRVIQYFVGLSDLSYIIEPCNIDTKTANIRIVNNNYRKVLNTLNSMNINTQLPKILTVCLREDVFYGTFWVTGDNVTIQQLPSDYCAVSSIEGNVLNVTFNFSYFDTRKEFLAHYPPEFTEKYNQYGGVHKRRWIELDSPTSFAIKCNADIVDYPLPPFAGILPEVYDIEEYEQMKLAAKALENYAMVFMKVPLENGEWGIDLDKAKEFWGNLDNVLPDEIGSVLTPMDLGKISFERSKTDEDTVAEAEQNLFTAAGVSSLLFNNEKAA